MSPEEQTATLRSAAKVAAIGLAIYSGVTLLGLVLADMPLAALVTQTVATEWGAGKLGVSWSNPLERAPTTNDLAQRFAKGMLLGVAPAALVLEWLHVAGKCTLLPASFTVTSLFLGLLSAALTGVRDQILFNGISRRVLVRVNVAWPKILMGGALFAARTFSHREATLPEILASFGLGAFGAALWQRDRTAYAAVAMNVGWLFATATLFHGAFTDVVTLPGALSGGDAGMASGLAAAIVLFACAFGAFVAPNARRDPA